VTAPPDAFVTHAEADYVRSHETGLPPGRRDQSMPRETPGWIGSARFVFRQGPAGPRRTPTYLVFRDVVPPIAPASGTCGRWRRRAARKSRSGPCGSKASLGVGRGPGVLPQTRRRRSSARFLHHRTRSYIADGSGPDPHSGLGRKGRGLRRGSVPAAPRRRGDAHREGTGVRGGGNPLEVRPAAPGFSFSRRRGR